MTNEALAQLYAACFPSDANPWSAQSFKDLRQDLLNVEFESEHGFLLARQLASEVEILTLLVKPQSQRQGQAQILLNCLISHCQTHQISRIILDVAKDNGAARALYEKFGFQIDGERKAYYHRKTGAKVNAILMSCVVDLPLT